MFFPFQIAMIADVLTKKKYTTPYLPPNTVSGPSAIIIYANVTNQNQRNRAIR
jgi:hypothetical protein